CHGKLNDLILQGESSIDDLKGIFAVLEARYVDLSKLDEEVLEKLYEIDDGDDVNSEAVAEMEAVDDYRVKFHAVQTKLGQLSASLDISANRSISEHSDCNRRSLCLPKIDLFKYNGDISQWITFWAQFSHINADESLSPEEKFQYLLQATIPKSRARVIVESFPPSGDNYSKAIESLKDRCGRSDLLIEYYVRELLKLVLSHGELELPILYDRLETQLRALETLKIVSDNYAAILLPHIESCLPAELLRLWQRANTDRSASLKEQMNSLMTFLRAEVEADERVILASSRISDAEKITQNRKSFVPTASELANVNTGQDCSFCRGRHEAFACKKAQTMSLEEKKEQLFKARACFGCGRFDHPARYCRARCTSCGGRHISLLCDKSGSNRSQEVDLLSINHNMAVMESKEVFLQTFCAIMYNNEKRQKVRVLIDSGSQRSYVLSALAEQLLYRPIGEERLMHSLFGGTSTGEMKHSLYKVRLHNMSGSFACNFSALSQDNIAVSIPSAVLNDNIKSDLAVHGIQLVEDAPGPIDILIGADIAGKIWSGNRKILSSELVAVETSFGWTLMGTCKSRDNKVTVGLATTITITAITIVDETNLWRLESLGISDPAEKKTKEERRLDAMEHFKKTVEFDGERYRVQLPWNEMITELPNNYYYDYYYYYYRGLAEKRLIQSSKKLVHDGRLQNAYQSVIHEWLSLGIIEQAEDEDSGHYLPHRPVVKESSSTTRVRPVFDGSAKMSGYPSLNDCLEAGPNLIELIPDILSRFRDGLIGVSADIEKAFLQIEIHPDDRPYLKFLWKTADQDVIVFRHNRVVFGVTCSPFLLMAVLDHHLDLQLVQADEQEIEWLKLMMRSFYVDNLACSLNTVSDVKIFKTVATRVMASGGFNLRGWEYTSDADSHTPSQLLGLKWNRQDDTLTLNMDWWEKWTKTVSERIYR
ncbi:unnamed protein product, partial [Nesidiocoris tenuis]